MKKEKCKAISYYRNSFGQSCSEDLGFYNTYYYMTQEEFDTVCLNCVETTKDDSIEIDSF